MARKKGELTPRQFVTNYGNHHAPPPEQLRNYGLLPKGNYKNIYEAGYIHNHTYANEPDGNLPSKLDENIISRNPNMSYYFLNSAGTLQYWSGNNNRFYDIARGYKYGPVEPVKENFNGGKGVDMTVVNYYDVIKNK